MARRTYVVAGPADSADVLTSIIETALGQAVIREAGGDPYVRADPVAVYLSGHDFDDGDIDAPDGTSVALRTGYPHLADIRDIDRNEQRQHEVAARIYSAIKADGRLNAIYVDDMQHVVEMTGLGLKPYSA
jgi:hypothetical protein